MRNTTNKVQYERFPKSSKPRTNKSEIQAIVDVFEKHHSEIATSKSLGNLRSTEVEKKVYEDLENIGFNTEKGSTVEKQHIYDRKGDRNPVHSQPDALNQSKDVRIEIEGSGVLKGGNNVYRNIIYGLYNGLNTLVICVPHRVGSQSEDSYQEIIYRMKALSETGINLGFDIIIIGY